MQKIWWDPFADGGIPGKSNFYCWWYQVLQYELNVLRKALLVVFALFSLFSRMASQFSGWDLCPFGEKLVADLKFYEWIIYMNTFVKYWIKDKV